MSANTTSYRYYKVLGVSGTLSGANYIYQFDFKVGSTNSLFYRQSYITNGTTANGIIVNQLSGGTFGIGEDNAVAKLAVRGSTSIGSSAYSGINPPLNGLMVEGNVGIGTTVVSAPLHVQKATAGALGAEISRLSYDASNYFSTYTSFVGNVTFDAVGSQSAFVFSDGVTINNSATTTTANAINTNSLTTGIGLAISSTSLTTGNLLRLTSTSTAGNNFSLSNIVSSGANANASRTATGQTIAVTNTGTTSTNIGLSLSASGATTNNALYFPTNASRIHALGTGANGLVLSNLKNSTNTSATGTSITIEISIGGTPYYFLAYPTTAP